MRYRSLYFALLPLLTLAHIHAQTPATIRAILEGDVVNAATGAPIGGARFSLDTTQTEPLYLRSDAGGHFLFGNLSPALYRLSVEAPGFLKPALTFVDFMVPHSSAAGSAIGGAHTSTCCLPSATVTRSTDADGTLHARISVPLAAYAVIAGRVTDPDGVPLEDCAVEILRKQPVPAAGSSGPFAHALPDGHSEIVPVITVQTNDKGEFRAARLEPGTFYAVANKPAIRGAWENGDRATYYPHAIDLASAKPLELAAGDRARANIRISRQPGIRVAGRLAKPEGAQYPSGPLLYTNIVLVPEQSYLRNASRLSTTGRDDYEFNDVLPGRYTLMALTRDASTDPYGGNRKAVFGLMQPFEAGDHDMNGVDLVLQPLRDLTGTVTFPEGCAPFPVRISAQSFRGLAAEWPEAVSGADGKFVLRGLGAGHFTVSVSSSGQTMRVASIRLGDRDVEKDGFDSPLAGDEPLRIEIPCDNARRP